MHTDEKTYVERIRKIITTAINPNYQGDHEDQEAAITELMDILVVLYFDDNAFVVDTLPTLIAKAATEAEGMYLAN